MWASKSGASSRKTCPSESSVGPESWPKGGHSEGRAVWKERVGLESDERGSKSGLYR